MRPMTRATLSGLAGVAFTTAFVAIGRGFGFLNPTPGRVAMLAALAAVLSLSFWMALR